MECSSTGKGIMAPIEYTLMDYRPSKKDTVLWEFLEVVILMVKDRKNAVWKIRGSHPEVFLGKGFLKVWSKFTGEHLCLSVISIKLQSNVIEIALRHGFSPVDLLHIFRTPFPRDTSGWLLLKDTVSVKITSMRYLKWTRIMLPAVVEEFELVFSYFFLYTIILKW